MDLWDSGSGDIVSTYGNLSKEICHIGAANISGNALVNVLDGRHLKVLKLKRK